VPQRSRIELLGLVETVIQMYYSQGKRQKEIADYLVRKGYAVSKGSVQRTIKSHTKQLKELKKKQVWAEMLISATNNTPRLSVADAGLQIAATKLLEEISEIGVEDFREMDTEKKVVLLTRVTRAIGLASNVELNFQRGRKQGIIDAGKKLEEAGKKAGLDDETMKIIFAEVTGIGEDK